MVFPKKEFEKMKKLSFIYSNAKRDFDALIQQYYGIHYSDVDDDWLIDTLDYGTGNCSYKEFCERMERRAKEHSD